MAVVVPGLDTDKAIPLEIPLHSPHKCCSDCNMQQLESALTLGHNQFSSVGISISLLNVQKHFQLRYVLGLVNS